jgi:hypothetical protein
VVIGAMDAGAIRRSLVIAALLLGDTCADGVSIPTRTRLMIGRGSSVVVEEHEIPFPTRESRFRIRIPAGVDPDSLVIGDPAGRARVIETRWRDPLPPALSATALVFDSFTRVAPTDADREVEVVARSSDSRARVLEAIYTTDALDWSALYEITVRGDIANYLAPLSADLEGRFIISNGLARSFSNARVIVRGPETIDVQREAPASPRGFLALDAESPLADLWRPRPPVAQTPQLYSAPETVTLPAGSITAVRFAAARRIPAERVFLFDGAEIPTTPAGPPRPLRQMLLLRNERRAGLGMPLPPGWVTVIAGAGRAPLRQQALLNHTPAGGWIRVNLGPVPDVGGARRSMGRESSVAGFTEETIELRVVNLLPSAVRVEIVERPPAPLAWDVVRCSRAYEVIGRRIRMNLDVPPRSEERISYTVRLMEPEG